MAKPRLARTVNWSVERISFNLWMQKRTYDGTYTEAAEQDTVASGIEMQVVAGNDGEQSPERACSDDENSYTGKHGL